MNNSSAINFFGVILCTIMVIFVASIGVYCYAWWNHKEELRNRALKYMMFTPLVFAGVIGIMTVFFK